MPTQLDHIFLSPIRSRQRAVSHDTPLLTLALRNPQGRSVGVTAPLAAEQDLHN